MDNNNSSWGDYVGYVADYIEQEYDPDEFTRLTDDEKWTIRSMIEASYHYDNAASNVATNIIDYLRTNRKWKDKNLS